MLLYWIQIPNLSLILYLRIKSKGAKISEFKYTTIPSNTRIPWLNTLTYHRCAQKGLRVSLRRSLVKKLSAEHHAILLNCSCDKKHLSDMTPPIRCPNCTLEVQEMRTKASLLEHLLEHSSTVVPEWERQTGGLALLQQLSFPRSQVVFVLSTPLRWKDR